MTLRGVVLDGLYGTFTGDDAFTADEITTHQLSSSYYNPTNVDKPMVLTHKGSELTLEGLTTDGGTVLKRGYNKTDAALWYTHPDYKPYNASWEVTDYHGGALFVDSLATVKVNGLVTITDNLQKNDDAATTDVIEVIPSNVYLPVFSTKLVMNDALHASTKIGVTSPKRNRNAKYEFNTMSPVAVADKVGANPNGNKDIAVAAWENDNFTDDQAWFFGNSGRTTYHSNDASASYMNPQSVYFGWTWANAVREAPTGFNLEAINSAEDLAWLISLNTGMNGVASPTDFSTSADLVQTGDIDLGQYVWVPIGISADTRPFAGNYDGQGHIIANMNIDFIGNGDTRYQRKNYGLFGYVKNGNINRTADGMLDAMRYFCRYNEIPEIPAGDEVAYPISGFKADIYTRTKTNGEYTKHSWYMVNDDGVPMVGLTFTDDIVHCLYPEYAQMVWDFCKHYSRDQETGEIIYNPYVR